MEGHPFIREGLRPVIKPMGMGAFVYFFGGTGLSFAKKYCIMLKCGNER